MAGSLPGSNSTSTTGPITWTIRPSLTALPSDRTMKVARALRLGAHAQRLGTADDVEQLLGDPLLPRLVVADGQGADQVFRVLGRRLHRGHPRPVLARRRLEQRPVDPDLDVLRQQRVEDRGRVGLIEVLDAGALPGRLRRLDG